MTPEDEAFNNIERMAEIRRNAVSAALKEHQEHMLKNIGDYERGLIDGRQMRVQSIREWVGLTDECRKQLIQKGWNEYIAGIDDGKTFGEWMSVATEAKLKERNT